MSEPVHASAAPVFTVAGAREAELARDCLALEVAEDCGGLRTLTAHFVASAPRARPTGDVVEYLDGRPLDFGAEIVVSLGRPGNEQVVFAGTVSALEATFDEGDVPHVTVFAEDALMALRMTRRSRTYRLVSDADLARRIAEEHHLLADVAADGPTYPLVQQGNETDLGFLRARAALVAAEVWATGTTVHFATRDRRRASEVTLTQGRDLLEVAVRADLAHQRSEVHVAGFDARTRDRIDERADGGAVLAEVAGGRTGAQVLDGALGRRPESRVRGVPLAGPTARAWATASMLRRSRRFVTAVGTTSGTPQMTVGSRVTLERVGALFDGPGYYTTSIRHRYVVGDGGLRTWFEAERATVNAA